MTTQAIPVGFDEYLGATPDGDFLYYRSGLDVYSLRVKGGEHNIYHNRNDKWNWECFTRDWNLHRKAWRIA